jgi:hypothetical protein
MAAGMAWRKSPNAITALTTKVANKASKNVILNQKLGVRIRTMPLIKSAVAVSDAMAPRV